MNLFLGFALVICVAAGGWLSKYEWAKLLALVPVAMLAPAFYMTGTACGAGFITRFFSDVASCSNGYTARQMFAATYVLALVPVAASAIAFKLIRMARAARKS
ncbi:hypothetical protein DL1_02230 [Thioclava dalianensis]|uniref:Uncharacterized protein n=1 Tax=Thioclava dalianensis TaxID=1185766 RepID=A0A074TDL7_9RHOB|nr:hypothetical protein [Thioclava dalianensis]KEP69876.1 hypothetical protein DL1_02230 [Thioclava dalianensis]SFM88022.1 hypothetical protein SAMN05216224_101722 [Thioclava dalianensis]